MVATTISAAARYLDQVAAKEPSMDRYALLAREHWEKTAPARLAALEDPAMFFETLGETIAAQVAQTATTMEQSLSPDLSDLQRAGQMRAITIQAEEIVLADLVYSIEPETSMTEELEDLLGQLPAPDTIRASLARISEQAEQEAAREGFSEPLLASEDQARQDHLLALLRLVSPTPDPEVMNETEVRDLVLALRPFWDPENQQRTPPQ